MNRRFVHLFLGGILATLAVAAAILATVPAAVAGHSNGHNFFVSNCATASCHDAASLNTKYLNGVGAASIINYANANGMVTGLNNLQHAAVATYLTELLTGNQPNGQAITFNPGPGLGAGDTFVLPNIFHSTTWGAPLGTGATSSVSVVSGSPSQGTVSFSFSGIDYTATYRPNACATGGDTFNYRASGSGGNTSTRTATVSIGNPTIGPTINSAAPPGGQTGVAYSHNVTVAACPSLATFSVTAGALPTGLTLSPAGAITGTPSAAGLFTGTITATYAGGTTGTQPFSINITLGPPTITSSGTAPVGAVGVVYPGYQIVASNPPIISYGASGLPPGLSVNPGTGLISGTPTDNSGSPYTATVTATNATGPGNRTVSFTINSAVPTINSANTASGQTGVAFTYQITATNAPTSYGATGLPPGLTLNTGTGAITGTPTTVGGPTNVTLTATNGTGTSANFNLAITITLGPPVITSALAASGGVAVPFNYQITATNPPHSAFNATGLPAGLTVNTGTGAITGTPLVGSGGTYPVSISATNAIATGNATLTLTISASAPVITSAGTASGQTGAAFTYQIVATNPPIMSYGASGLPPGLSVSTTTGLISGTPTAPGTFNGTITATNGAGFDTDPIVFTITLGPPVITSPATAGAAEGFPFTYQITATNSPTSFGASGLPAGLTVNPTTGLISGTPTVSGTFSATTSATNATATGSQGLTITVGVGIPVIDSAASASGGTGLAFIYQITASNNPTSFNATGLPAGLSVNTATGLITGTPVAAGTFTVNLSATNASGTGTRALTITISLRPPGVVPGGPVTGTIGVPFSHAIQTTNGATGFTATGLPPGLSLNPTSGLITGTPTASGTYAVTVGVTNSAGTTTFTLTIIIGVTLPTVADTAANVPYETATPIALPITGEQITVNIVVLPAHGLVTVQAGSNVVTYSPAVGYTGPDSFSYTVTNPAGTTGAATVNIIVVPVPPTGLAAAITVPLNTATTFSLAPFIKGSGITGVSIHSQPSHGTATVNGLLVTYTPRTDYFGSDAFSYIAHSDIGSSPPATVSISVVGRPDPLADRDVVGLVEAQNQAARRFSGAQIGNIQRRMESLHRADPAPTAGAPAAVAPAREPTRVAAAPGAPATTSDLAPVSLVSTLMHAVASRSVDVNGSTGPISSGTALWVAGSASFGHLDATGGRSGSRFGTDGISLGADRRFGERLALGAGLGFARDEIDIGTSGTRSKATGASVAGYGSYQLAPRTYIDALLGYGQLRFDSDRYVTALEGFASGRRKGKQVFGSVAAAYEHRRDAMLLSPYGRLDFSVDRLDSATESGVGDYALTYGQQTQRSLQAALGMRAESKHETEFGWAVPRARAEYRREFQGDRRAGITYADLFGGEYSFTPSGTSRNSLLLGVGADLIFRGGLRLGIDYQAQRTAGASNVQGIRLLVSQDLDALGAAPWRWEPVMLRYPITVDFGYAFDDNVNRGREPGEKRWDNVFSISASQSRNWALGSNMRVQATALLSGEKFDRHAGLGRFSGGAQAELQYRGSGAFDATMYAFVGRALYEQYESSLRSGPRYFVGINARRALTDRIELFGELGANYRDGKSDVFNWRDYAAKLNLDYSLGRKGTLYFTGEYRRGDTVSSGFASLANVGVADVFAADDAFEGLDYSAYRFEARTILGTVGVNYPLGARDSIDVSWRRVQSTPRKRPSFDFSGPLRYIDNQYSIVYLMRF